MTIQPLRRNRNYLLWLTSDIFMSSSKQVNSFANPLIAFYITHSTSAAGLVAAFSGLASLVLTIPGGVISDSLDRRKCEITSCAISAVSYGLFGALLLAGHLTLPLIILIATVTSSSSTLFAASGGIMRRVVAPEQYPTVLVGAQVRGALVGLIAGPVSGFLLTIALATPSLVVAFGCSVAFIAALFLTGDFAPKQRPESLKDISEGLLSAGRWCLANPFRLRMALVECTANIGINAVLFCVDLGLAKKGVPATKFGVLTTAAAIAFLIGALAAPSIIKRVGTGILNIVALTALTAGTIAIPFISHFALLLVTYAAMNISLPAAGGSMDAYYLSITPVEMTGRVGSFMSLLSGGLAPFGIAVAGWGISEFGFKATTIGFAGVVFSGWLVCVFARDVRRIPRPAEWESYHPQGVTS